MENAKFVTVDGIKTRYFEGGSGDALVLIHGGQFGSYYSADYWGLNFEAFCADFHVYAFDKLGQGFTDNPKNDADYTMSAVIDHTDGFIRTMGIEKAVLLGHSRGALPAARIAVDHPDMVKALIILASNTLAADDSSTPMNFYTKLDEGAPPVPNREFVCRESVANSYSKDHITDDFAEAMLKIALLPKTLEARMKMSRLAASQLLPEIRNKKYETLDQIKDGRLKAPTAMVWGLNDPSASVKLGMDLLQLIGSVVDRTQLHVVNHAGHYLFRERPEEFHRLVISFVKG